MKVEFEDLGVMPYKECWEYQQQLFDEQLMRRADASDAECAGRILFVEHPPVYTLGKSGNQSNMLVPESMVRAMGAEFYHIDRGGDITFHGPGQLVGYPILDLERLGIGLRRYVEILEQSIIDTIAHYGISGGRLEGATGVWLHNELPPHAWRKICAIGVRASHFVTMHGFALNCSTDLSWFSKINPCGFTDKGVTSIEKEIGAEVDGAEVRRLLLENLVRALNVELVQ